MARTFRGQASKRVSFALTTRNRAGIIEKALEQAYALVGPEDELIVIDGGSTDGTAEIIERYVERIDAFISEPDLSGDHAINKGMLVAQGRYFKHLTDDDEFSREAMEQAIAVMEANPTIDVLACGGMREFEGEVYPVYVPPGESFGKSAEDVFTYGVCGCGFLIRRSAISLTGLSNPLGVATDAEFIAKAINNGAKVRFCRVNLFHHPIYEYGAFIGRGERWRADMDRIAREYCSRAFYLKLRSKNILLRRTMLRKPALALRSVLRRAFGRSQPDKLPVWDTGLS